MKEVLIGRGEIEGTCQRVKFFAGPQDDQVTFSIPKPSAYCHHLLCDVVQFKMAVEYSKEETHD